MLSLLELSWRYIYIPVTPKKIKKVIKNLESWKVSVPDCITDMVL